MLVAHNVSEARIMCFRFSLMRETDTKITSAKSWAIVNNLYTKIAIWQFGKIGVLVNFIIQELKFCKVAQLFCVSVSLVRENLRELIRFFFPEKPSQSRLI